tara:strand:- start:242 stop:442 length:201 start_codon:yes stop_codon:yes gene_type:complete
VGLQGLRATGTAGATRMPRPALVNAAEHMDIVVKISGHCRDGELWLNVEVGDMPACKGLFLAYRRR